VEVAEHIDALRREGALLAAAAERTEPDTAVPTCPGWVVRDLVIHLGGVHRWAASYVRDARPEHVPGLLEALVGDGPDDADLVTWFRQGHGELVEVLTSAPADLECFTFLAAPSPLAMWARRQAHETAIHRVDAEIASGPVTTFPPAFAADGIDELLTAFITRRGRGPHRDQPATLQVDPSDAPEVWSVTIGPGPVVVTRDARDADVTVRGPASDLYQLLCNRRDAGGLAVDGDGALLDHWREAVRIRAR
jgi:uncharacterized protein (TIGR03083 family)